MMPQVLATLLFLTVGSITVFSQTGYKIDFNIKGWSDTTS